MKKMWIRKTDNPLSWEIGCQVCGRLVSETDCHLCALGLAWRHIHAHREVGYDSGD